ncbi:hypothetical protein MCHIJ_25470 [Mycolicibacterium chitae]|uniref:Lipid droplet-associated protein n=1 Tax=Mycolicibacterium chitae TaxID=1792 RepID=A0A448I1K1_MYCCI|nr:lipid droplet-associated protein [Mycolicibacterium chitae]MCV7105708.1 lipid droplet-associated protein [Mycolicibacterium chitae]BBZ03110.1 hypothetical protein MCHIJ_25470 [Mycolicibacterium chitae]VEG46326.1 Uncharacterised protein [Mycolicibacterium chitae]
MSSAPYGVRLLVGVAATAVEETRKLPQTILMSPMSLASQFAHLVMKVQQDLADLVIKGDSTLETLFPPKDEQPEWATFDEDEDDSPDAAPRGSTDSGERMTEGRFALYSTDEAPEAAASSPNGQSAGADVSAPDVASRIDYASLTLAQLRARLQSLSVDELSELLAFEEATKARAPFQTLLANRITRASAK